MQKVQIRLAVSEIGKIGSLSSQNDALRVTAKAQVIVLFAERRIELWRVFLGQQTEVLATVGYMAPFAILLCYGAVQELLVLYLSGERSDRSILAYYDRFIVTRHAKFHRGGFQPLLDSRGVRGMAIQAAACLSHRTMFVFRCLGYFLNVFVT